MSASEPIPDYDLLLVGGGLQNALIALARLEDDPSSRIAVIERGPGLGGNHTWCFHADDVPPSARSFVEPLVQHRWMGYDVLFPGFHREIHAGYAGLASSHLHRVVTERLAGRRGCSLLLGVEAREVGAHRVVLADGRRLQGALVVDGRGPSSGGGGSAGFQKFVGQEIRTARPHGLMRPTVMDATVPQRDGFRFFYLLPLGPDRLLVEDTYFSDTPHLDRDALRQEIAAYVERRGFATREVVREEEGVLPMPWAGSGPDAALDPLVAGYRGGWAHPATGYSFPIAVRLAALVGRASSKERLAESLAGLARQVRRQARFAHLLNRMLFRWFLPHRRRHVFERFYRLPAPTILRFYALQTTTGDRLRLLVGRPPRGFSLRARLSAAERLDAAPCA